MERSCETQSGNVACHLLFFLHVRPNQPQHGSLSVSKQSVLGLIGWVCLARLPCLYASVNHLGSFHAIQQACTAFRLPPPLLFAHYFEAKVGRGHLLGYSICIHPLPPFLCTRSTITMTATAFWKNSSFTEHVLQEIRGT